MQAIDAAAQRKDLAEQAEFGQHAEPRGLQDQPGTDRLRLIEPFEDGDPVGRTVLDVRYDAQRGGRFGLAVHRAALFGVLFRAARREAIAIETNVEVEALEIGAKGPCWSAARDARQVRSILSSMPCPARLR